MYKTRLYVNLYTEYADLYCVTGREAQKRNPAARETLRDEKARGLLGQLVGQLV